MDIQTIHALREDAVTPQRWQRMRAYRLPEDRARCYAAGLLERCALGIRSADEIALGKSGKPQLRDGGPCYNISHAGQYVVLATCAVPVGVDVERLSAGFEDVARICFTPEERALAAAGGDDALFRIWTAKEAVMKLTGLGLSLPPERFEVLPLDTSAHRILGRDWFFQWIALDGHVLCTATADAPHHASVVWYNGENVWSGK